MTSENSSVDVNLADKLKRENPEQFQTLVRMHLSFELDLHTDDNDCVTETAKLKKWSLFPKKTKCASRGVMEGAPLTQEGICQVYQLIEYLTKETNICQEGIFRRTGSLSRQQELRALLNAGTTLDLDAGIYSVHDCASVLKGFLAELPEPLLTNMHYPAHCQIAELCGDVEKSGSNPNEQRLLCSLQLLLLLLPAENRVLLKDVLDLLNLTASYENQNKMSADSLATLFTPHLLCPRKISPEALHVNSQTMSGIVSFMIRKGHRLFDIPPKLATDIRAYFVEREKKKILSPRADLNESVSDGAAVNTVFSFVDHERTAEAHTTNPTEAALAQLYAHIQSLPESANKRKLIKQFNKENGQGTPLQVQRSQKKDLKTKSLGNSIKKHIFQKSLAKNVKRTNLLLTPVSTPYLNGKASSEDTIDDADARLFSCTHSKVRLFEDASELLETPDTPSPTSNEQSSLTQPYKDYVVRRQSSVGDVVIEVNATINGSTVDRSATSNEIRHTGACLNNEKEPINTRIESLRHSDQREGPSSAMNGSKHIVECTGSAYLTSTPARNWWPKTISIDSQTPFTPTAIGRRSMSPITRSTRRMSKAMQESMMTPRSRKPVLLISGTNICQLTSVRNNINNSSNTSTCNYKTSSSATPDEASSTASEGYKSAGLDDSEPFRECQIHSGTLPHNAGIPFIDMDEDKDGKDDSSFQEMSKDVTHNEMVTSLATELLTDDKSFQDMPEDNLSSSRETSSKHSTVGNELSTDLLNDKSFLDMSQDDLSYSSDCNSKKETLNNRVAFKLNTPQFPNATMDLRTFPQSETLTNSFQNYLVGRKVLSISPDTSHNFDCDGINDVNDSKLSDSLLYCLDGNDPNGSMESPNTSNRKRYYISTCNNAIIPKPKELTIKMRKVSETGDVIYETSL